MKKEKCCPEGFCKGVTVGTKGQIVLPIELRKDFNIKPGDTVMVCKIGGCICIVKSELFKERLTELLKLK